MRTTRFLNNLDQVRSHIWEPNKNVDTKLNAHHAFLEQPSSGVLKYLGAKSFWKQENKRAQTG